MLNLDVPYKQISKIEGYEDFEDYYIDINSNVYSVKKNRVRKIKHCYFGPKGSKYCSVFLYSKKRNTSAYVHILMVRAFIPASKRKKYIYHKSGDKQDNRLENLVTTDKKRGYCVHRPGRPKKDKKEKELIKEIEREALISDDAINKIKLVHLAAIKKGLHVSESFAFLDEIIEELLDEYCSRKGLKKILHQLKSVES